jgi:hypothetical protein
MLQNIDTSEFFPALAVLLFNLLCSLRNTTVVTEYGGYYFKILQTRGEKFWNWLIATAERLRGKSALAGENFFLECSILYLCLMEN